MRAGPEAIISQIVSSLTDAKSQASTPTLIWAVLAPFLVDVATQQLATSALCDFADDLSAHVQRSCYCRRLPGSL